MFVKNVKPAVVVLNGQTVIPPLAVVEVDGENSGVQSLIESGHLVEASEAETPQQTEAGTGEDAKTGEGGENENSEVVETETTETQETPEKPEKPAGKNK